MKDRIIAFVKKETVLVIATILAIVSMFFVPPSLAYLEYIDWRVLGILLSLMLVMAGYQKYGVFDRIGAFLLQKTKTVYQLVLVLVFLCFFSSMLITNDVALITFVPFAILILKKSHKEALMIPVVVYQTIAANLGSMLTPLGNPQNLYLYNASGMDITSFLMLMLPYTVCSAVLLLIAIFTLKGTKEQITVDKKPQEKINKKSVIVFTILFVCSLLVVLRVLPWVLVLALTMLAVLFVDPSIFKNADYSLLLTFISFFIFIGNMGNIEMVQALLKQLVEGKEVLVGILASQCISNVPAALLLSGFTENYHALTIGVNLGGLGTMIASMASLISYKAFAEEKKEEKGRYFVYFTVVNLVFLGILSVLAFVLA